MAARRGRSDDSIYHGHKASCRNPDEHSRRVESRAEEYAEYQGPVPVVRQPDGGFQVRHKDGSLTGDGFRARPRPGPRDAGSAGDDDGSTSAGRTGSRFSGAGSAGPGQTGAGSAGSRKAGAFP